MTIDEAIHRARILQRLYTSQEEENKAVVVPMEHDDRLALEILIDAAKQLRMYQLDYAAPYEPQESEADNGNDD